MNTFAKDPTFDELPRLVQRTLNKIIQLEEILTKVHSPQQPEIMTMADLAKLLNLSSASIYGLVHKRKIPFIKRGKRLYFKHSEIMAWLEKDRLNK